MKLRKFLAVEECVPRAPPCKLTSGYYKYRNISWKFVKICKMEKYFNDLQTGLRNGIKLEDCKNVSKS